MSEPKANQGYLNTKNAAAYLDITIELLRQYVKDGKIKSYKPGGKLRLYRIADLDEFITNSDRG